MNDLVPTIIGFVIAVVIVIGADHLAKWCNRRDR